MLYELIIRQYSSQHKASCTCSQIYENTLRCDLPIIHYIMYSYVTHIQGIKGSVTYMDDVLYRLCGMSINSIPLDTGILLILSSKERLISIQGIILTWKPSNAQYLSLYQ